MDKYEEALERAREYYDFYKDNPAKAQPFIDIFPELAESEDERIRKEIIGYLNSRVATAEETELLYFKRWIAYLEKQKINTEGDFGRGYDCGYEACLNSHGAEWFEKQKESLHIAETCKENANSFTDADEDRTINGCLLAANAERRCKRASEELLEELGLADYTKFFYEQGVEKGKKEREKQKEQPEVDLEKEIIRFQREDMVRYTTVGDIARHFYSLGLSARKE